MKNRGFYITSLIATGKEVENARVDFTKGPNLIFGGSETGKSHIMHLIEYIMGKRKLGVNCEVAEGAKYDTYYLEIATFDEDKPYTLCRKKNAKTVVVKPVKFSRFFEEDVKGDELPLSSKSNQSISSFLLSLCGFDSNLLIKKAKGSKTTLSFTPIRNLILANEGRVVSDFPIFNPSNQHTEATYEKSIIYYLTSGEDDAQFIPSEDPKVQKARISGKIEYIDDVIKQKENQIQEIGDADYADFSDAGFLKEYQRTFDETESELNSLNEQRISKDEMLTKLQSKKLFIEAFLNRIKLLHEHYVLDLERYDFIYQGHQIIEIIGDSCTCPLCKSVLEPKTITSGFSEALKNELANLIQRKSEAESMIESKQNELSEIDRKIQVCEEERASLSHRIRNAKFKIDGIRQTLLRYQQNIEAKTRLSDLQSETQTLYSEREKLKGELKQVRTDSSSYERQSNIKDEFCQLLQEKLKSWELADSQSVVFDEGEFDFVLGGKKRLSCGKGARGVTCSAILMTLAEYCIKHDIPFTRTLVIDSPITAHFSDAKMSPEETTQNRFFKYLNDAEMDYQLIIMDNKSPNEEERKLLSNINYIEFSSDGRQGFYPIHK